MIAQEPRVLSLHQGKLEEVGEGLWMPLDKCHLRLDGLLQGLLGTFHIVIPRALLPDCETDPC